MNPTQQTKSLPRRGKRHPLLYQQRFGEMVFWPAFLILILAGAIVTWNPVPMQPYRPHLIVAAIGSGLILVLTQLFRLRAYIQCRNDGLHVRAPFYQWTIPYREVQKTRVTELGRQFPIDQERWTRRHFLEPLLGKTVIVVELNRLPESRWRLGLSLGRFMVCSDAEGLILAVRDWMALRTELDEFRARTYQRDAKTT